MRLFLQINKDEWMEPFIDEKSGDVALNYTYDNLTNPSEYVSEYSFSIKVKRSPENERLFEHVTRLDSTSAGFNPAIRYEYVIISDFTDIISRGSCFVDVVDDNELKLSMLGSLNYVFNKLINSGWDTVQASEDSDYTLLPDYMKFNGASYTYKMNLTRRFVWTSWMIDNPIYDLNYLMTNLASLPSYYGIEKQTDWRHCFAASLVGFAPTNCGYYDSFSADKWYYTGPKSEHWLLPALATNEETDYEQELTDRQICEYRSYYQKPFVYVNKLFQIFQRNFSNITGGWTLNLDSRWFSDGNPLYFRATYVLPNVFNDETSEYTVNGSNYGSGTFSLILPQRPADVWDFVESHGVDGWVDNIGGDVFTFHTDSFDVGPGQTGGTIVEMKAFAQNMQMPWTACWGGDTQGWSEFSNNTQVLFFNPNAQFFKVQVQAYTGSISLGTVKKYAVVPMPDLKDSNGKYVFELNEGRQDEIAEYGDVIIYRYHATSIQNGSYPIGEFQFPCYYTSPLTTAQSNISVHFGISISLDNREVTSHGNTYTGWQTPFDVINQFGEPMYAYPSTATPYITFTYNTKYGVIETKRSGSELTMERLFNGTNPFSVLLKFTKMNNLIWLTDEYTKTVTVMHRYDYFLDCMTTDMGSGFPTTSEFSYMGLLDVTPYIETKKNYEIKQPSWDTNRVTFNFGDGEEDYADGYEEKYGRTFGSKVIVTENRKNSDNKDLFCNSDYDTIKPPVCSTQIIQPVRNIKTYTNIKKESEAFISNVSDDKNADVTDRFFLRNLNREWMDDINGNWRDGYVYISDDIVDEYFNNDFAYHGGGFLTDAYKCEECPQFMMSTGNRGVIFGMPREVYAGIGSEQRVQTLYEAWWQKYIENIYSGDNKRFTCYLKMSSMMYRRLKTNPLVQFENCAYLVAKIDGWNEKNEITKVTLVQIGDINELTNNQLEDYDDRFWLWDDEDGVDYDDDAKVGL